jgi:hypothetical protein
MNVLNIPTTSDYNSKIEYSKKFKLRRIKDINIYLTYINCENEIEIISRKKLYIENKENTITRNQMVDIIKNNQRRNNIQYKLISVMVYNINVTPETLSDYIEKPEDFISLFTLSRIDSFELQSTISILKEFNALYFFFFEVPQPRSIVPPPTPALPSSEPSPSDSREKGEKGEKGEKEIENQEMKTSLSESSSTPKKPNNTTKRIYINEKSNSRNNSRVKNQNNKTKRYDKYVNML